MLAASAGGQADIDVAVGQAALGLDLGLEVDGQGRGGIGGGVGGQLDQVEHLLDHRRRLDGSGRRAEIGQQVVGGGRNEPPMAQAL